MKQMLGRSPLPRLAQHHHRRDLRVLAYHGVPDADAFDAQVGHLTEHASPVSIERVHDWLHRGRALPDRAVLITFDDGDRTVVDHGLPVLRRHGVPAVVYVITDLVDSEEPFWWHEVEALAAQGATAPGIEASDAAGMVRALKRVPDADRRRAMAAMRSGTVPVRQGQLTTDDLVDLRDAGVAIGSHTASHPCLDRCDEDTVRHELDRAHRRLTELLGAAPTTFAYPNGNLDLRAEDRLRELDYASVFLFDHRVQATVGADPFRLSRIRVGAGDDIDTFRLLASGAHSWVHHTLLRRS